jgi:AAA15 family ATPase/GTPase
MKLIRAHINNYKSFRRSGEIVFAPGFNIFIGQNDAGKSALMEALSTKARYIPHRSLATAQTATTPSEVASVFEFTYSVTSSQLKEYFHRLSDVCLPIQKEGSSPQQIEEAQTAFAKCLETDNEFTSTWHSKQNDTHASPLRGSLSGLQRFNHIGPLISRT